jgi:hypothetical protein
MMTPQERAALVAEVQVIERKKALEEEQKQASELIHKGVEQFVVASKDNPLAGKELKTK